MRLILHLNSINTNRITANYYYPLSAAIYKLLRFGSEEFSQFLHDLGYRINTKRYKLFTFSLKFGSFQSEGNFINLITPEAKLIISSPLDNKFIKNFISGSLQRKNIEIYGQGELSVFEIEQISYIPAPIFTEYTKFIMLSPMVLSIQKIYNGKLSPYYLRYHDNINEINKVFNQNLINKYKAVYQKDYNGEPLTFSWDHNYINRRLSENKKITKKISIQIPDIPPINIIGNQAPFELKGNPELMKVGYECGFGGKNSMGFGMAKVIH